LDIAIGGQFLIPDFNAAAQFYVPLSYTKIRFFGRLEPHLYSHCRYRADQSSAEIAVFDVTIYADSGEILVDIEGFHLKQVQVNALDSVPLKTSPVALAVDGSPYSVSKQDYESLFETLLGFGIDPEDGAKALQRVLSLAPLPSQILISSMPFDRYCAAVTDSQLNEDVVVTHENLMDRPALATAFEALRSPIEQSIADIWQVALGINNLGRHDGFFELGGHSLLLIQIIARLKKRFSIQVKMADLFEVTTIAKWAEVIGEPEIIQQSPILPTDGAKNGALAPGQSHYSDLPPVVALKLTDFELVDLTTIEA